MPRPVGTSNVVTLEDSLRPAPGVPVNPTRQYNDQNQLTLSRHFFS